MAGLSLCCSDYGALLKSVAEAQEYAVLTKHSNFFESTEAVLNLLCITCSKPCRSKTIVQNLIQRLAKKWIRVSRTFLMREEVRLKEEEVTEVQQYADVTLLEAKKDPKLTSLTAITEHSTIREGS